MFRKPFFTLITFFLLSNAAAIAQSVHSVTGKVVDVSDGSSIQAADIIVTDMEDRIIAHGASDSQGSFYIGGIKKWRLHRPCQDAWL